MNTDAAIEHYLREGESSQLERPSIGGGYLLGNDWFGSEDAPEAKHRELYAMPAATAVLLEDKAVDLKKWLIEEASRAFDLQREPGEKLGPARVLRDPYTAKPYVLFYVTAPAFVAA